MFQEYVGHFREWGKPSPPVKTLCPLDPSKVGKKSSEQEGEGEDSSKEESNERKRRRNHFGGARPRGEQNLLAQSMAQAANINGRRVLLCSFNGITFQVSLLPSSPPPSPAFSFSLSLSLSFSLSLILHSLSPSDSYGKWWKWRPQKWS